MSVLHRFTKLEQGEMRWENVRFALQAVAQAFQQVAKPGDALKAVIVVE